MRQFTPGRKAFGKRLQRVMTQRRTRRTKLAAELHVRPDTITSWRTGRSYPDAGQFLHLCAILHVRMEDLITKDDLAKDEVAYHAELARVRARKATSAAASSAAGPFAAAAAAEP
jgi:transcriptional regulator with XRE-family HTH domain